MTTVSVQDKSRKEDLNHLEELAPKSYGAKQTIDKVYKQSKDGKLAEMRNELVKAHGKSDVNKSIQIEESIRRYTQQTYGYGK